MTRSFWRRFRNAPRTPVNACRPTVESLEGRSLRSVSPPTSLLVPAYFNPSDGNGWKSLTASVSPKSPITAIMNPDSGPGTAVDASYPPALKAFRAAGGKVVGYVSTKIDGTNTLRPLAKVEAAVDRYRAFYKIDGVFVDQMSTNAKHQAYYHSLYAYIKKVAPTYKVIGNPGTATVEPYLNKNKAADVLVTFEDNQSNFVKDVQPTWVNKYAPDRFAAIVGKASSASTMSSDLATARKHHAAYVYVTDQNINVDSSAYGRLPTYWSQEVAAVRVANS